MSAPAPKKDYMNRLKHGYATYIFVLCRIRTHDPTVRLVDATKEHWASTYLKLFFIFQGWEKFFCS